MTTRESGRWRVEPGKSFDLSAIDPDSTAGAPGDKAETRDAITDLHERTGELQERLHTEGERSLLFVLQAMDAGGKDGAIKGLYEAMNPQGLRIANFKAPTEEERQHDFLWRIHRVTPRAGEVTIFNRSHYEDVLIVRVKSLVPEKVWRPRYEQINHFEELLAAGGTRVVKVYLHISPEEQKQRFRDRLEDPTKRWKYNRVDLELSALWDGFMEAFQDALETTSTDGAPWYAVPADHKWYRDWAIVNILRDTLEEMDPRYPMPPEDEVAEALKSLGG